MTVASPQADPDREVLERVAAGDREAFTELVERHQERVLRLAERFLGDPEEARDAAQEVFFKVYRKAGSFSPQAKVSTWIHRITVNHCLNRLRRRKIVRFLPFAQGDDPEDPVAEPADEAPGPEEVLASRRRWRATREAIDSLPLSQRSVLVLAKLEGLSYKEIAETLGISLGAVESRLFRAMRTLEQRAQETRAAGVTPRGGRDDRRT